MDEIQYVFIFHFLKECDDKFMTKRNVDLVRLIMGRRYLWIWPHVWTHDTMQVTTYFKIWYVILYNWSSSIQKNLYLTHLWFHINPIISKYSLYSSIVHLFKTRKKSNSSYVRWFLWEKKYMVLYCMESCCFAKFEIQNNYWFYQDKVYFTHSV